jgi:CRISPR-associated protein Cas6/Cse3/CasE subtype I-E
MKHIAVIPDPGGPLQSHKAVWDLVGGENREFLFASSGGALLVSSTTAFPGSQPSEDSYSPGTDLSFRVTLDAVRRYNGKRRRSVPDFELSSWFEERLQGHGFSLRGVPKVVAIKDMSFEKDKDRRIHYHAVTFEGRLQVSDTEVFKNLLHKGVGRGKSYGLGLFLAKPF